MFILRSEMFGLASPFTNIPYALETNEHTHCKIPHHIFTGTNADGTPNNLSHKKHNYHFPGQYAYGDESMRHYIDTVKKSYGRDEYERMNPLSISPINFVIDSINYPLINSRHVFSVTTLQSNSTDPLYKHSYGAYSLSPQVLDMLVYHPIFSFFKDLLPVTPIINPRLIQATDEVFALREGCFTVPNWTAYVDRPIAIDVRRFDVIMLLYIIRLLLLYV